MDKTGAEVQIPGVGHMLSLKAATGRFSLNKVHESFKCGGVLEDSAGVLRFRRWSFRGCCSLRMFRSTWRFHVFMCIVTGVPIPGLKVPLPPNSGSIMV